MQAIDQTDTWVLASNNAGKVKEFQHAFEPLGIQVRPMSDWDLPSPAETGLSFIENALIKARHASQATGLPALADDSGLSVDALQGAPGIYSARYAGADATDTDNIEHLLQELKNVDDNNRQARFICALAWVRHAADPVPVIAVGQWHGRILKAPQGEGGFGYDPVFWVPESSCAAAELSKEAKQAVSHRGLALKSLLAELAS